MEWCRLHLNIDETPDDEFVDLVGVFNIDDSSVSLLIETQHLARTVWSKIVRIGHEHPSLDQIMIKYRHKVDLFKRRYESRDYGQVILLLSQL